MGLDVGNQALEFSVGLADLVVERVGANQLACGRVGVDELNEGVDAGREPVQVAGRAREVTCDACELGTDGADKVAGRFAQ